MNVLKETLRWIVETSKTAWPVITGFFVTVFTLLKDIIDFIADSFVTVVDQVANFNQDFPDGGTGVFTDLYTKINVLFPLDYLFACLTIYVTIYVASVIIRIIKSWIPTVA